MCKVYGKHSTNIYHLEIVRHNLKDSHSCHCNFQQTS